MLVWISLSFKGLSTIYKSTVFLLTQCVANNSGSSMHFFCHQEDNHHGVDHDPAEADGDNPYQGHQQEEQGQIGGEKFKSSTWNHMYWWCSHCASKTYICQNTQLENLNLSLERFVMLVYSFSEIWKYHDFSCHSTEPIQKAWKPQFWPADFTFSSMAAALYLCPKLVNLSRSGCLHVTFKWHNYMQLA